ncbi:hypothetical protein HSX11_18290 [Oxalobacteraceae bacterium]|nr:hypothetical protein [Oxalobacteraceae bacterium]
MLSSLPFWWLALPVLLLPVWWHRRKRERRDALPLATARFLPSTAPAQMRVWRWREPLLLLLRCLLLAAAIAWLAATIFPWRGDTVLVDADADQGWVTQQIAAAGFTGAARAGLPADVWPWLAANEREWRSGARFLVLARDGKLAMPAHPPQLAHGLELRVQPPAAAGAVEAPSSSVTEHRVALAASPEKIAAWRALFRAFEAAGGASSRYVLLDAPDAATELAVWDLPASPPAAWRAPLWWLGSNVSAPELANAASVSINGLTIRYADSPRGRMWASASWPPQDAEGAGALYQSWKALHGTPPAYAAPAQAFAAAGHASASTSNTRASHWLDWLLLGLFTLERIATHARRH